MLGCLRTDPSSLKGVTRLGQLEMVFWIQELGKMPAGKGRAVYFWMREGTYKSWNKP